MSRTSCSPEKWGKITPVLKAYRLRNCLFYFSNWRNGKAKNKTLTPDKSDDFSSITTDHLWQTMNQNNAICPALITSALVVLITEFSFLTKLNKDNLELKRGKWIAATKSITDALMKRHCYEKNRKSCHLLSHFWQSYCQLGKQKLNETLPFWLTENAIAWTTCIKRLE